jgi:hypothetical protein
MVKTKNILRNAKQFSIFFLSENCFANNCPNALGTVFCFIKLFSKTVCQTLFIEKTTETVFFFFFFVLENNSQTENRFVKRALAFVAFVAPQNSFLNAFLLYPLT